MKDLNVKLQYVLNRRTVEDVNSEPENADAIRSVCLTGNDQLHVSFNHTGMT